MDHEFVHSPGHPRRLGREGYQQARASAPSATRASGAACPSHALPATYTFDPIDSDGLPCRRRQCSNLRSDTVSTPFALLIDSRSHATRSDAARARFTTMQVIAYTVAGMVLVAISWYVLAAILLGASAAA